MSSLFLVEFSVCVLRDKKRERGNFFYRREDFSNAVQCYRGALRFLDLELNPLLSSASVEDRSILIERYIQVENNVAQVNLQLNRFDSCLTAVENVLRYDPTNGKALFRQGKALFQLGRYDLALQSLTKLPSRLTSSSDQESLQQMIQTSRAKIESYQKNEKEIYKRMFQPKTTTPSNRTEIEVIRLCRRQRCSSSVDLSLDWQIEFSLGKLFGFGNCCSRSSRWNFLHHQTSTDLDSSLFCFSSA